MMNNQKLHFFFLTVALLLCVISLYFFFDAGNKYHNKSIDSSELSFLKNSEIEDKIGTNIDLNLSFINHFGEKVNLYNLFNDKAIILILGYYNCPMLCSLVMNGILKMLKNLELIIGEDFDIISLSIDPEEDCNLAKQKRKSYLLKASLSDDDNIWQFLVGNEYNIRKISKLVGFGYEYDLKSKQYLHSAGIFILTKNGKLSKIIYGINFKSRDIKFALIDASNGKIGTIIDKIFLSCFHYDPDSHRYGVYIFGFMKICGALIFLFIIILIFILKIKEQTKYKG